MAMLNLLLRLLNSKCDSAKHSHPQEEQHQQKQQDSCGVACHWKKKKKKNVERVLAKYAFPAVVVGGVIKRRR